MGEVNNRINETANWLSRTLYTFLKAKKKSHSEVLKKAESLLMLHEEDYEYSDEERAAIIKIAVDLFEKDVGITTYEPTILDKDKKSIYWLNKVKSEIPHSYFSRYRAYLASEGYTSTTIDEIESTCEKILSRCANPKSGSNHDQKRGLVLGDVQSGKTANYLGLINMAYDYGYKIVLLLAGTTDSLRLQTQKRTDSGVIGAKSDTIGDDIVFLGVGEPNKEHYAVPFTNQEYDFAKFISKSNNAEIGDYNKPVVLVVKKVKGILESVSSKLLSALKAKGLDSKSLLIIDDEADNASVNTSKDEISPTTINRCIRDIFNKFPIVSYVGYTATPFANIFINPYDDDKNYLDLFPSDFIVQLHASSEYFGGRKVFPHNEQNLPRYLRKIEEIEPRFLPVVHDKYYQYEGMTDSLKEAVHFFLIDNVIRTLRGKPTKHRSMMINITRFNDVQERIRESVDNYIQKLNIEIEQEYKRPVEDFCKNVDLRKIYEIYNTNPFYRDIREGRDDTAGIPWEVIQDGLYSEITQFITVVINSRNGKMNRKNASGTKIRFDYEDYEEVGARVVAIGGMILSRGLTLEGLMISYYSRNAGTYDTLLQMCRWFGYRQGYEDLCRIYLSQVNIDRFDAVLESLEDLRLQLDEMERQDKKPQDFGLMIKDSPDTLETTLLVTSRNKMRGSEEIQYHLNFGGVYADTSKLSVDPKANEANTDAFARFYNRVKFEWINKRYISTNVPKSEIANFLGELKIPYVNKKFDVEGLKDYIATSDVFPTWDVVIATGNSKIYKEFMNQPSLQAVERSFHVRDSKDKYIRIGGTNNRVMEPGIFDAGLWLTNEEKERLLAIKNEDSKKKQEYKELTINDYLKVRKTPLLVVYPIELKVNKKNSDGTNIDTEMLAILEEKRATFSSSGPLLAFAIGFPRKESPVYVTYRANKIKLAELNAEFDFDNEDEGAEDDD